MNTNKANEAKKELRSIFINSTVVFLAIILTVASIIPIFGPALVSYIWGLNKYRNKHFGLSKNHILSAILISGFILLFISCLIDYVTLFFNPKIFWLIVIIVLISNLFVSLILFFIGDRRAKKNKK